MPAAQLAEWAAEAGLAAAVEVRPIAPDRPWASTYGGNGGSGGTGGDINGEAGTQPGGGDGAGYKEALPAWAGMAWQ